MVDWHRHHGSGQRVAWRSIVLLGLCALAACPVAVAFGVAGRTAAVAPAWREGGRHGDSPGVARAKGRSTVEAEDLGLITPVSAEEVAAASASASQRQQRSTASASTVLEPPADDAAAELELATAFELGATFTLRQQSEAGPSVLSDGTRVVTASSAGTKSAAGRRSWTSTSRSVTLDQRRRKASSTDAAGPSEDERTARALATVSAALAADQGNTSLGTNPSAKLRRRQQRRGTPNHKAVPRAKRFESVDDTARDEMAPNPLPRKDDELLWRIKKSFSKVPLLTPAEELMFGAQIQELMQLEDLRSELFDMLGRHPSTTELLAATGNKSASEVLRVVLEGKKAKRIMVGSNMRLVVSIARRYQNLGVHLQDLIQEGALGLIRATEKYDPDRGFRFSTYATWWIQQSIFRSVAFQSRVIRLPMHVHNFLNKVRTARKEMFTETGQPPSDVDLANRLAVPPEKLRRVLRCSRPAHSSSQPLSPQRKRGAGQAGGMESSEVSFEDYNKAEEQSPEELVEQSLFRDDMQDVLEVLSEDERLVICLRYGLGSARRLSCKQIAHLAASTVTWVKRTEARAMRKLRRAHYKFKLRPYTESHASALATREAIFRSFEASADSDGAAATWLETGECAKEPPVASLSTAAYQSGAL